MVNITGKSTVNWAESISSLLPKLMYNFDERFGYPPDDNHINLSTPESRKVASQELAHLGAHRDLLVFYSVVEEVVLPDAGVGFFIDSPQSIIEGVECGNVPTYLAGYIEEPITAFGSDGGGHLFALSNSGRFVYILSDGSLAGSTYDISESVDNPFADGLHEFMGYLLGQVAQAADSS